MYIRSNPQGFGLFGASKGYVAPAPAAPPEDAATVEEPDVSEETAADVKEPEPTSTPGELISEIRTTERGSPERRRLLQLLAVARKRVASRQAEKLEEIRGVKAKHAAQAAYGRGVGYRPPESGYATESEAAMGGRSGYYAKPKTVAGYFGQVDEEANKLDKAADEVEEAAALVKQLTKDVKAGVIPKSELSSAISDLRRKAAYAKGLSERARGLSGYGEGFANSKAFYIAIGLGLAYFLYKRR